MASLESGVGYLLLDTTETFNVPGASNRTKQRAQHLYQNFALRCKVCRPAKFGTPQTYMLDAASIEFGDSAILQIHDRTLNAPLEPQLSLKSLREQD
jgi:hypothetical protein